MMTPGKSLAHLLAENPFISYTYSYPHKTAYRPFEPPIPLADLWANENRQALFLYFHVPFCEMRCGFCNLFTMVNHDTSLEQQYLAALRRQAERTRAALGDATFARLAIGGGTPTHLDVACLGALFDLAENTFGVDPHHIPVSVETSPLTATPEKLGLLRQRGVDRISIGVQSFIESEVSAIGRSQKNTTVDGALRNIRDSQFPTVNIDLIYGLPAQTVASWLESVRMALEYAPEELYLYPLYVRPLTGLDRFNLAPTDDIRLACYRAARDVLLSAGYTQVTMRMFRSPQAPVQEGPVYCVQDDGMVGLGCGARTYTRTHHYSSEYAVSKRGVQAILADYLSRPAEAFDSVQYGMALSSDEQRRRYVIKSLLEADGLNVSAYQRRFGGSVWQDLPQLADLLDLGLAVEADDTLRLTARGLERSDTIGPWLYSQQTWARMEAYELR
jgi:oxygen-independent coproporphyrinogen-3 oxidase